MRALVFTVSAAALTVAWTASAPPLKPGDRIGRMQVLSGRAPETERRLTDHCNPVITEHGVYHRSCTIAHARHLWIGYGNFAATLKELNRVWAGSRWRLVLDHRAVALKAFGTVNYHVQDFAALGGADAYIREWAVRLVNAPLGKHTVRYIQRDLKDGSVIDVTFTIMLKP